jgi:hypothetical protein
MEAGELPLVLLPAELAVGFGITVLIGAHRLCS